MFSRLLHYATSGISSLLARYAVRASVVIPFLFAFGYGLAGVTTFAIETYGYRVGYFVMGGAFFALGLFAAIAVWLKERSEDGQKDHEAPAIPPKVMARAAIETGKQLPNAFAGGASGATSSVRFLLDGAAKNWPLVVAAGMALILLSGPISDSRDRY